MARSRDLRFVILFFLAGSTSAQMVLREDFRSLNQADLLATGALWGFGALRPGEIGGPGIHGDFVASDGRLLGTVNGVTSYEWSTDAQVIPGSRTLNGQALLVTAGVFHFASFWIRPNERVVFVGRNPAQIHVSGVVLVEGSLDVSAPGQPNNFIGDPFNPPTDPNRGRGQPGGPGGPGGQPGGDGANSPAAPSWPRKVDGDSGQDVFLPPQHPYAANRLGTAGWGSLAWPANADPLRVCFAFAGNQISLMVQGGGGGGSLFGAPGAVGTTRIVSGAINNPCELGPDSGVGHPLFTGPVSQVLPSEVQFLIGGAGGGGGGTQPIDSFSSRPPITWRAGGGGGGGGGALLVRAGSVLATLPGGTILARGGNGPLIPNVLQGTNYAGRATPGGGGSGGSLVLQARYSFLAGGLDVRGGDRGVMTMPYALPKYQSLGGEGGPGFVRVETSIPQTPQQLGNVQPPATADNVGMLAALDDFTAARSLYYPTNRTGAVFARYEVELRIGGTQTVVLSDDPTVGPMAVPGFSPVGLLLQGATRGSGGNPTLPTRWSLRAADLNVATLPDMVRWTLLFDRTFFGNTSIEVRRVDVVLR